MPKLIPRDPNIYFHWSPISRRKQINNQGLVPGKWSRDHMWKPPYICLAESPRIAWILSGGMRGAESGEWDLWEVWTHNLAGYERLFNDTTGHLKEVRVYERIYKRNVWLIGQRRR